VRDFLIESRDHLTAVESGVLVLEQSPARRTRSMASSGDPHHQGPDGVSRVHGHAGSGSRDREPAGSGQKRRLAVNTEIIDVVLASRRFSGQVAGPHSGGPRRGELGEAPSSGRCWRKSVRWRSRPTRPQARTPDWHRWPWRSRHRRRCGRLAEESSETMSWEIDPPPEDAVHPAPVEPDGRKKKEEASAAPSRVEAGQGRHVETRLPGDMAGELVIAQVAGAPRSELAALRTNGCQKFGQLGRITDELQKTAMRCAWCPSASCSEDGAAGAGPVRKWAR